MLFQPNPIGRTQITSIKDAMTLPAFNAMYAVDNTLTNCKDPLLGTAFIKAVVHDAIRAGGKNIDYNFFFDMFGFSETKIDTTRIFNRYLTDIDYNIYVDAYAKGSGANADFTAQVARENHSGNGKYSYPAKYYTLVDKENQVWYSIEDVDTTVDYAHVMTLRPLDQTVIGELKPFTKYMIVPARFVGGYSAPQDTSAAISAGFVQTVSPFRLRRDWKVQVNLMRGYADKLRFTVMWDKDGNKMDAWDAYEAQTARDNLQFALNILAFMGTPVTNSSIINGTGATIVDDVHTGFFGLLPTLKYGGGNVIDFDYAAGFDLDGDLEPFILQQDALKQTSRFLFNHGKAFKAGLNRRSNRLVKYEGLGLAEWMAFQRTPGADRGQRLTKMETSAYEYLGYVFDFKEWGALNDTRHIGNRQFDNLAVGMALDGIVDANTNQPINSVEFFQYGNKETGDYFEAQTDQREITRIEEINGYCAQSIMMATHVPYKHLLLNPAGL